MSRRRTRQARRGYVLVMFAMLAFAFFALAALVIDMGMVRLTQRQMQSATDSAALEGLRFRDGIPSVLWPPGVDPSENPTSFQSMVYAQLGFYPDPTTALGRDQIRRVAASQMVSNIFDDDLNPNDTDTSDNGQPGNYGAGPVVNFSGIGAGTVPSLAASQQLGVPPPGERTYNPGQSVNGVVTYLALQTNLVTTSATPVQQQYGDMVSGTYGDLSQAQAYDATYGPWSAYPREETAKGAGGPYDRRDFIANPAPDERASPDPAFLVRMRRLNPNDFQNSIDSDSDVSTFGPPLPFLFARGSMMLPTTATSYQPRVDGLTVRATSVASVGPITTPSGTPYLPAATSVRSAISLGVQSEPSGDSNTWVPIGIAGLGSITVLQNFWQSPISSFALGNLSDEVQATSTSLSFATPPSPAPPDPGDQSGMAGPQPLGFLVQVDSELMRVQSAPADGKPWKVVRGSCGTVAAPHPADSPVALVLPLHADGLGNILSAPISVSPPVSGTVQVTCPTCFLFFQQLVTSAIANAGGSVPALFQGMPTAVGLTAAGYTNPSGSPGFSLIFSSLPTTLAVGSQLDLILTASPLGSMDAHSLAAITVSTPVAPAVPFVAVIHDPAVESPTAVDPNAEYVRVTSIEGNSWNIERGIFLPGGEGAPNHARSTTGYFAITPLIGFAPTQLPQDTPTSAPVQFGDLVQAPLYLQLSAITPVAPLPPLPTLGAAGSAGATSITLSSASVASSFPSDPDNEQSEMFLIVIDGEIMLVQDFDDASTTNWTVVPAQNGTISPPAGHLLGAYVALLGDNYIPITDDVTDQFNNEYSGRIVGFGRAAVQPDATPIAATIPVPQIIIAALPASSSGDAGTVAKNATAMLRKPFAADLSASGTHAVLWAALMNNLSAAEGPDPLTNVLLVPTLFSTVVPPVPLQQ